MNSVKRFFNSLTTRLQIATVFASLVGVAFSFKSYLRVKEAMPEMAPALLTDLELQLYTALVAQVLAWYIINKLVIEPIVTLIELMRKLGDNQYDVEVPFTTVGNQIGSFARKVKVFKDRVLYVQKLEDEQKEKEIAAEKDRSMLLERLSTDFDKNVSQIAARLNDSGETMKGNANHLCSIAADNAKQLKALHSHASGANEGLGHVAAAAEELSSSIQNINDQISRATLVTRSAVQKADSATHIMHSLTEGAARVHSVLSMIAEITSQINLLALNATIEAARAGEQGKGFAVVASEVKNLASKTAASTTEISEFINAISAQADQAANAIQEISQTINTIDAVSGEVANAIVAQSAATQNIARNIQATVQLSNESKKIVDDVSVATQKIDTAAEEMLWVCTSLSSDSANLNSSSRYFVSLLKEA